MVYEYVKERIKEFMKEEKEKCYKYFGKEVIDVGDLGFDSIFEFYGIVNVIWRDWKNGEISMKMVFGRFVFFKFLIYKIKNKKIVDIFEEDFEEVRKFIDYVIQVIKNESRRKGEFEEERQIEENV